jgi:hypothetical protein
MRVSTLRSIIDSAIIHEDKTNRFQRHLRGIINELPNHLYLQQDNELESLENFSRQYISQVPNFLLALKQAAQAAGIESYVFPFLKVAEEYFIAPPLLPHNHLGLMALMDESYLAHRLFEEINDRYITAVGIPLIPWDMTLANVVAHQLVGESLANELDELVHETVNKMMNSEHEYDSERFKKYVENERGNLTTIWQDWPCLSKSSGIEWAI